MVTIFIDGRALRIEEGTNILEAALQNGIYIPHLCHHPDLLDLGSCRLCIVEVEGQEGVQPSCKLAASDGMVIRTRSEQITKLRNLSMELLLAAHPEDCSTCPKYGKCELQTLIQYMGVSATRMASRIKGLKMDERNPLIIHDMNRCVLCGRCVRACKDLRQVGVLQYNKKNLETYVGTLHDKLLKDADCRFCGACAEVCPTGTIRDAINWNPIEKRDTLIPCAAECPAHADVPRYVRLVREGRYDEATAVIHERIPFPECLGRICAHTCEGQCRRGQLNEPISIRNIKRYAAEHTNNELWKKNQKRLPASGKRVCVVGGGPAGMTAAFYLAKQGHDVTIKERYPTLGGQMSYGIPAYRLPREVIAKEASYLSEVGVHVEIDCSVTKPAELLAEYDAVLMAVGTHEGNRLKMPGNELPGVLLCSDFLRKAAMRQDTGMGKSVVIMGGGNVAFDCARTAVRLGAEDVSLAFRKKRVQLTADSEEIEQAEQEGVHILEARTFDRILGSETVEGVEFSIVKRNYTDDTGRSVTEKQEGSAHVIPADTVIFAAGQHTDLPAEAGLERGKANSIAVKDGSLQTSVEGIFACGDAVYGTKTVIRAVASGRQAASEIDRFLGGDGDITEKLCQTEAPSPAIGRIEGFSFRKREEEAFLDPDERRHDFRPISNGICDNAICSEAERCLQCDLRFNITDHRLWSDYPSSKEA
ncbi:MAG: FAD-dependent oxidoreductase [Oscillospiraceae bacterium]|nr:FAD-dependent oxidoreductase [Oscillospiraceae bacterium]